MQRSSATIAANLKKVPPFPPVAVKLLSMLSDPAVDTGEVADLISSDATFTARLLQRVNSAQFSLLSDITNVRRAVTLLGLDTTRQITVAQATAAYAHGGLKTETMRRCWQHTVATAVVADEIALACNAFTAVAFTAGIMHDIGRLGLLVAYPDEYERIIHDAAERSLDVLDFEAEEFGVHHAEAGRMLGEQWGLPAEMLLIAGRHHDPCEGTELDLLRIVHVACRLADALGYDVVKPLVPCTMGDIIAELPARARAHLTQEPEDLRDHIERRVREFGASTAGAAPEETLAQLASNATGEDATTAADPEDGSKLAESALDGAPARPKYVLWLTAALIAIACAALLILQYR